MPAGCSTAQWRPADMGSVLQQAFQGSLPTLLLSVGRRADSPTASMRASLKVGHYKSSSRNDAPAASASRRNGARTSASSSVSSICAAPSSRRVLARDGDAAV